MTFFYDKSPLSWISSCMYTHVCGIKFYMNLGNFLCSLQHVHVSYLLASGFYIMLWWLTIYLNWQLTSPIVGRIEWQIDIPIAFFVRLFRWVPMLLYIVCDSCFLNSPFMQILLYKQFQIGWKIDHHDC